MSGALAEVERTDPKPITLLSHAHFKPLLRPTGSLKKGNAPGAALPHADTLQVLAEAGNKVTLPCSLSTDRDFTWWRNKNKIKYKSNGLDFYDGKSFGKRLLIPSMTTNISLVITNVQLSDSGSYTCEVNSKKENPVQLIILQISAEPSPPLIMSEDLTLTLRKSLGDSNLDIKHSWMVPESGGRKKPDNAEKMVIQNIQIDQGGTYTCHVKANDKTEMYSMDIRVLGILPAPDTVYISHSPVYLPWHFNFNVRDPPLVGQLHVIRGGLYYSLEKGENLRLLSNLSVSSGVCWPHKCHDQKLTPNEKKDLGYHLSKPKGGWYHMVITLELGNRQKQLSQDICALHLNATSSPVTGDSQVTLLCKASCMPPSSILRLHQEGIDTAVSGQRGKRSLELVLNVSSETIGKWNCSLFVKDQLMATTHVPLASIEKAISLYRILLWVAVAGAAILLLIIAVIVTLAVARCRRKRRARYRAWLIQTLHQRKRCECKGFASTRLTEMH
ncbi:T-cell surface glycoprotein CD4 [Pelodytes ibericus]